MSCLSNGACRLFCDGGGQLVGCDHCLLSRCNHHPGFCTYAFFLNLHFNCKVLCAQHYCRTNKFQWGDGHQQAALLEKASLKLKGTDVLFDCSAEFLSYDFKAEYKPQFAAFTLQSHMLPCKKSFIWVSTNTLAPCERRNWCNNLNKSLLNMHEVLLLHDISLHWGMLILIF